MAGSGTPLVPAGELDVDGAPALAQTTYEEGEEEEEAVSGEPDFRPPDLIVPARLDDPDL
jgi:hypothetical protein